MLHAFATSSWLLFALSSRRFCRLTGTFSRAKAEGGSSCVPFRAGSGKESQTGPCKRVFARHNKSVARPLLRPVSYLTPKRPRPARHGLRAERGQIQGVEQSYRHKTLHREVFRAVARLSKIPGHLHSQPDLGCRTEGFR